MTFDVKITSRRHPLVQRLRAAARRDSGEVLLDGPHLLAEALRSQAASGRGRSTLLGVVVTHRAVDTPEVEVLCDEAVRQGVPVQIVADSLADAISPAVTPTGVVALADVTRADLDTVTGAPDTLLIVLAGVQDPGNVGTIVRTAEAAGASGVVLLDGTADALGWKAMRGSMGSALRVPLYRAGDGPATLGSLRARGIRVVAADNRFATTIERTPDLTGPLALLVGAEGQGLAAPLLAEADASVHIPVAAPVESLNVAVATALLLFAMRQARGGAGVVAG